MFAISNPGTGFVGHGSNRRNADRNMRRLIADAGVASAHIERDGAPDENGRYPYVVKLGRKRATVDMPGLALERVRFVNEPGQNAWHFPRLYVDGSSWLWEFAVPWLRLALGLERDA